jgi:anti-sigma regulatory factor (Ser/Thr protein kinase)
MHEMLLTSHRRSTVSLHRTPLAPRAARRYLEGVVRRPEEVVAVAELLVTELVTNSVRHGGGGEHDHIQVEVDVDERRLRVDVRDEGGGTGALEAPRDTDANHPEEGGFGLLFVDTLADRWGSERSPAGTTVWFEIDLDGRQ